MDLLVATHNPGKFKEIADIFRAAPFHVFSLQDFELKEAFEEHGKTFEANALGKARFYFEKVKIPTLADDSGLLVDALAGELGVMTRRWGAGASVSDEEWLRFFLNRMVEEENRKARFVCAAAYVNGEEEWIFFGTTEGVILSEPAVPLIPGIPLSSVFQPEGCQAVYAALPLAEKNKLSHRGKAFTQMRHFLSHD